MSRHLDSIISSHSGTTNAQIVFVDVVKYSRRRTLVQRQVVEALTRCLETARLKIASEFVEFSQTNHLQFHEDIIVIPTGDGAAVCFTFDGLNDLNLKFAMYLLEEIYSHNQKFGPCELFKADKYCNQHPEFEVRVGVDEGRCVIYKDINGNYNVAGNAINLASRVMGKIDGGQVAFSEHAYKQLIDMIDDPALSERFKPIKKVRIKFGEEITIYQLVDPESEFVNSSAPELLTADIETTLAMHEFGSMLPALLLSSVDGRPEQQASILRMLTAMVQSATNDRDKTTQGAEAADGPGTTPVPPVQS